MLSNSFLGFEILLFISISVRSVFCDTYRLPETIIPKHYKLKILASVEDVLSYKGTVEIVTQCLNATKKISLHRDWDIKFEKIEVNEIDTVQSYEKGDEITLDEILYSKEREFVMISTIEELKENQHYLIYFEFEGNLSETQTGIFRGNIPSSSGNSYYAVSVFEPMGARKAFPCFDEPGMIATFELTVGRREKYNTTSNMQLVKSEPIEGEVGWYFDHFMNSFPMSTYMLCFMIYDAEFVWTGKQKDQIKLLVRKESRSSMGMVLKTAPKLLAYLQKYFQVHFPFPKVDVIALPHKMGNKDSISTPGLIIMHEKMLFYEAFSMKQSEVQLILQNVAEGITLQWMSELALEWWSDVWIRSSLANYNARNALSEMSESQSLENDLADALLMFFHQPLAFPFSKELYGDSTSVRVAMSSADNRKFQLLLRMAQHLSRKKDLKDISMNFLKQNSFQRVNQEDLWKIFEDVAPRGTFGKEAALSEVMSSWMYQVGFPEINVIRDYKTGTATLNQKEYHSKGDQNGSCWWIPITYVMRSDNQESNNGVREWMKCPQEEVVLQYLSSSDWLLLNYDVNFLYRVNYDLVNWKHLHFTLENPMSYNNIPSLNRMQLIDDLFEFTARGNLTYEFLYEFLNYLKFEDSYAPWAALSKNIFILYWRIYSNREAVGLLNSYMQRIMRRPFNNRKFYSDRDAYSISSFNLLITEISCFFGLPDCLREVRDAFEKYRKMEHPFHIDSPFSLDLREIVFCYAIKHDSEDNFDFLFDAFSKSTNIFEKQDMLSALFCTRNIALLEKIPSSSKKKRSVEHKEESNFQFRNIRGPIPKTVDKLMMFRSGDTEDETTSIDPIATEDDSFTGLSDEGPLAESLSSITESVMKTTSSQEDLTPSVQEESSPKTDMEVEVNIQTDSELPKLEHIIFRCEFSVVSDIFYKNIVNMDPQRALYYISIFTDRINSNEDLEIFRKFVDENEEKFGNLREKLDERMDYVKNGFVRQKQNTNSVIRALKKTMKVRDTRSDASRNSWNRLGKLFSISPILSIFLLSMMH